MASESWAEFIESRAMPMGDIKIQLDAAQMVIISLN